MDYQVSMTTAGITLHDGDTMEVQAGGVATSTTAFGGPQWATINVESGGVANSTVLSGAVAIEFVEPNGADNNATVNNGTELEIEGNASKGPGTGTGATVNNGGELPVDGFGVANNATINKGGNEFVDGTDNNATLSGGRQFIQRGNTPGVVNETTILSDGLSAGLRASPMTRTMLGGGTGCRFRRHRQQTRPCTAAACRKSTAVASRTAPPCSPAAPWRSSATGRPSVSRCESAGNLIIGSGASRQRRPDQRRHRDRAARRHRRLPAVSRRHGIRLLGRDGSGRTDRQRRLPGDQVGRIDIGRDGVERRHLVDPRLCLRREHFERRHAKHFLSRHRQRRSRVGERRSSAPAVRRRALRSTAAGHRSFRPAARQDRLKLSGFFNR